MAQKGGLSLGVVWTQQDGANTPSPFVSSVAEMRSLLQVYANSGLAYHSYEH